MDVKDKVYISLQECLNESEKIPTSQIADNLHLSRQIVTHYFYQIFLFSFGSLTVDSIFSLTKLLKTLIISMLLSFFIVKFVKINVVLCSNVWYNRRRR